MLFVIAIVVGGGAMWKLHERYGDWIASHFWSTIPPLVRNVESGTTAAASEVEVETVIAPVDTPADTSMTGTETIHMEPPPPASEPPALYNTMTVI